MSHMQQTPVRTTQLGATGLEITRVGFGAWAIGEIEARNG
jgi:aryl-alcohol dehydrogenase-like predicted oxidoreductase